MFSYGLFFYKWLFKKNIIYIEYLKIEGWCFRNEVRDIYRYYI